MAFGTFDLLHPGHLNYLHQAKKQGDYLIVVLARDKVKAKMGKLTLFSEKERLFLIQNLAIVDEAVLGYLSRPLKIVIEKKPDVICLGYDHHIKEKELLQALAPLGLKPVIKRMKPYHISKYKSSLLKAKISQRFK